MNEWLIRKLGGVPRERAIEFLRFAENSDTIASLHLGGLSVHTFCQQQGCKVTRKEGGYVCTRCHAKMIP